MKTRIPSKPPVILPLPENEKRPLWSIMIPTYNCSKYLAETIESVLQQAPAEDIMQIEVIDDYSTDTDVKMIVEKIGKGRVKFFRQQQNIGSLRNFETCINRAKGHYIHILHGDDRIKNGFYKEIESLFNNFPEAGAAFTNFRYIDNESKLLPRIEEKLLDEPGILPDWQNYISMRQRVQPPAMVVKRSVYERLGSFYAVHYGEDWEMWSRIAAHYPVAHSPAFLAAYRTHNNNISTRSLTSGQNINDILTVIEIIGTRLPEKSRRKMMRQAKKNFAHYYSSFAHVLYHEYGNVKAAIFQAKSSLKMSLDIFTLKKAAQLYFKVMIGY